MISRKILIILNIIFSVNEVIKVNTGNLTIFFCLFCSSCTDIFKFLLFLACLTTVKFLQENSFQFFFKSLNTEIKNLKISWMFWSHEKQIILLLPVDYYISPLVIDSFQYLKLSALQFENLTIASEEI